MAAHPDLAIGFADLVGYTAATEAHGDELAAKMSGTLASLTTGALVGDTRLVKTVGDAVMIAGPSNDLVGSLRGLLAGVVREPDFPLVRVGAHVGPVVDVDGDLFGTAVNLAARIVDQAEPMQVLVSSDLRVTLDSAIAGASIGHRSLRNIEQTVELFELDLGFRSGVWWIDPVCRMRVDHPALTADRGGVTFAFCSERCRSRFTGQAAQIPGG